MQLGLRLLDRRRVKQLLPYFGELFVVDLLVRIVARHIVHRDGVGTFIAAFNEWLRVHVLMRLQPRLIDDLFMSAYRRLYFWQHLVVLIPEDHVAAARAAQLVFALRTHNELLLSLSYQRLWFVMHDALSVAVS